LFAAFGNASHGGGTSSSEAGLVLLTLSAYVLGAGVGVYCIANLESPNISFWGTIGYSVLGAAASAVLISILSSFHNNSAAVAIIAAFCPVLGSMFYALFIADWPQVNKKKEWGMNFYSQKDIIEMSKIYNVEIVRIEF
jgi:hypothetical protein